jgi:hypothetical protein
MGGGDDPLTYPATSNGGSKVGGSKGSQESGVKGGGGSAGSNINSNLAGEGEDEEGSEYEDEVGMGSRKGPNNSMFPTLAPAVMSTSECPPNTTNATGMMVEGPSVAGGGGPSIQDRDLVRQLAAAHYHSYGTALGVTIGVGCCLLLLNLLIFLAIYHQKTHK